MTPDKLLHWPPGVIVTCLALKATRAPNTGANGAKTLGSF
jgi:hypothetical protein